MVAEVCDVEVPAGPGGSWAVAKNDLAPGQIVLVESPLVSGPGRNGKPICLACYSLVDAEYYCSECGWQLCSEMCETAKSPHSLECALLKEKVIEATWQDVEEDTFCMDFIGPLRLLLAVEKNPKLRKELLSRDMQTERRQIKLNTKYYENCETVLMKYLKDACGLSAFSDQEILNALGLFEMFGVGLQNGARAIFPTLLTFQHKCSPNTYMTFLPDGRLVVRASVQIKKGELVTRSLVEVMQCTQLRRIELDRSFLIDCQCSRCSDPTEMGTGLGGLCSPDHPPNKVFLPSKPLEEGGGPWICSELPGVELSGPKCSAQLQLLTRKCADGVSEAQGSTMAIEFILNSPGEWDVLPKNGQVMLGLKQQLVSSWGSDGLDLEKLHTKISYCEELLSTLSRLHPGRNYSSAMLHYELASTALALLNKGDKTVADKGAKHAESGAQMCSGEEGTMYAQLGEYVKQLALQLKA